MLEKILDGICSQLSSSFEGITVYTESVENNVKNPYFVVKCESAEFKRIIGNRFHYRNGFKIVYCCEKGKALENFDLLCEALEYIKVDGDLVRGTIKSTEIVDDVITIKCSFNMTLYKVEVKEKMEELVQKFN